MLADALTRMPFMTPQDALAASLAKARSRLPIGQPASRMDGQQGTVVAVELDGMRVAVVVEMPDGTRITDAAGYWHGRSVL